MSTQHVDILNMRTRRTKTQDAWRLLKSAPPTAMFGMFVILIYVFVALTADWIAPYPETWKGAAPRLGYSLTHFLGTDSLGGDLFSRLIFGAKNTLGIALVTVVISFFIGGTLGIYAAVTRGWFDLVLGRIVDVFMAIPVLIFALMLLAMLGKDNPWPELFGKLPLNLIMILAVLDSTRVFRLARNTALSVAVQDFVEAARLRGEGMLWIVFKEIVPNILPPLIAEFGLRFCFVFLTIAALSFLGVGISPELANWGQMIKDNATQMRSAPRLAFFPAGAIALLTIAVNFVVDWFLHKTSGLRDEK
jgi:peptide/nickel transport system permease protein